MAYADVLDETKPAGVDALSLGDDTIRTHIRAIRQRLASVFVNVDNDPLVLKDGATGNKLTLTRVIAGADIAAAVAKVVGGDGTLVAPGATALAGAFSFSTASAAGTVNIFAVAGKQTVATAGALDVSTHAVEVAHVAGTVALAIGLHATAVASGNGGTTTSLDQLRVGNFSVSAGAIVTTLRGIHITGGANAGTITQQVGLDIDNVVLGGTNIAIRTGTGLVQIQDDIWLTSLKKLFLDGGSNTYVVESAADVIDFVAGGINGFRVDNGATSTGDTRNLLSVGGGQGLTRVLVGGPALGVPGGANVRVLYLNF